MADEFAKGFTILVGSGLAWMTLAGWYNTPSFEGTQLTAPDPETGLTVYDTLALVLKEGFFWFAILGFLTFVFVIPALRKARDAYAGTPEIPE
ncbi:DUF7314 family protein [Halosegnis marinus]|uniref:DUF7314 domain-containing protein n=1 Tax=Halosegnis marinus TaxID=3034023 RepID=A0ABD5ZRW7_9EURY|nr:hypothetical protein [Halosegnis sp. DT85]